MERRPDRSVLPSIRAENNTFPEQKSTAEWLTGCLENSILNNTEQAAGRIAKTAEGKFALLFALTAQELLGGIMNSEHLRPYFLQKISGGPEDNPYRMIDIVGGNLTESVLERTISSGATGIFVEEWNEWRLYGNGSLTRYIIIDPVDGTSTIGKQKDQATGILVADAKGKLLAAAVASLNDTPVLFLEKVSEKNQIYFLSRIPGSKPVEISKIQITSGPANLPMRIAILDRRLDDQRLARLGQEFASGKLEKYSTFGGAGLLDLLQGKLDAMIDPYYGQPLREPWGFIAQNIPNLIVTDLDNLEVNYQKYLLDSLLGRKNLALERRVPVIISRTQDVYFHIRQICQPPVNSEIM